MSLVNPSRAATSFRFYERSYNIQARYVIYQLEMSRLSRRLEKLEVQLTDVSCLAPHTPEWLAYWERRVDRILSDEDSGLIPLEVVDAIVAA